MKPVANQSLQSAGLMSVIMLRGPSSERPPGPPVFQSAARIGSGTVVRGQGDCHAQLAKINNTAHVHIHIHKCTIVHRLLPMHACLHPFAVFASFPTFI